ncbi:50S ribosomal protein L3 [Candidatus Uhrbacteria bacterium CG_4_9_14_3_um_filter_41_35]|uniref:Large ribosomal subunit protein uL3 n=1 Tax=Candidatus Uhrbacteria bacterium CG_4_9_14_3_um_filter_41_35 TaxID=1975034 RepID=A0A2M7XG42_9BACT|nr:MAG: 50S ribosomal protein L3 [Candidatus Uhrbacteria bacterium CG11_big_fil_rev_8_21_14_0_20_41_9]PJA46843.1 MAG: 50S ribosomal protein L3 [Candidatus Uhrbacteria bacterium CG_4_9_14_3_um_filter_41_35]
MKVLLGKKIEMTQLFKEDGTVVPVTLIEAGPNVIAALKVNAQGVNTKVIGFGSKKSVNKPQREEWKGLGTFAFVAEVAVNKDETLERGQIIGVDLFSAGEKINVVGVSKGKGFQGVVKRHGFKGGPASHGHKDQLRMPGSIGAGGPQRVFKGTKMGGRMGGDQTTVKNLEIVNVDTARNIVAVKGAVPGARGSFVKLMSTEGNVWQK